MQGAVPLARYHSIESSQEQGSPVQRAPFPSMFTTEPRQLGSHARLLPGTSPPATSIPPSPAAGAVAQP